MQRGGIRRCDPNQIVRQQDRPEFASHHPGRLTMIVDRLDNAALYFGLGERIALALKYLKDNDCTELPVGKIPIQGEQVFAIVQDKVAVASTWK